MPIFKGCYVSWQPPANVNRRYGCVMSDPNARGFVEVQASNAKLLIPAAMLRPEPDCQDAIVADQQGIYAEVANAT